MREGEDLKLKELLDQDSVYYENSFDMRLIMPRTSSILLSDLRTHKYPKMSQIHRYFRRSPIYHEGAYMLQE